MRNSTVLIVIAMVGGIAVLLTLGTWQVNRLKWKENLIAGIQTRVAGEPVTLRQIENLWGQTRDVDYMAVSLQGRYDHEKEMYYFNTWNGQAGWNVITPFRLADDRFVLLNRGFVPTPFRDKAKRQAGQIEGMVAISGLARNPVTEKPNSLVPDNQLARREFFWKSQSQMISLVGEGSQIEVLPFMVDAGASDLDGGYPLGGTTRVQFSNNHLQYALTWYGLALSLLAVGSVFLYGRGKQPA